MTIAVILTIILVAVAVFVGIVTFCLCRVSADADQRANEFFASDWDDEKDMY